MNKLIVLLFIAHLSLAALPINFEKCRRCDENLNKCLKDSVTKAWPALVEAYNLRNVSFNAEKNIPNLFIGKIINGYMSGIENVEFNEIYIDFKKQTFDVIYSQPLCQSNGGYSFDGGFMGVKINDHGYIDIKFKNGTYNYHCNFDIVDHNGEEYIKIKNFHLEFHYDGMQTKLESKDNSETGKRLTQLFNDFWRVLSILTRRYSAEVIAETYTPILQQFFDQHPLKDLFE